MIAVFVALALAQSMLMGIDEGWFHARRGLPRWERRGHPLDTLTVALVYGWLVFAPPSWPPARAVAVALALLSCLFVTKDEPVHARVCSGGEQWVHAVLFVIHPLVFAAAGWLWWRGAGHGFLVAMLLLVCTFGSLQALRWNGPWQRA